MRGVTPEKMKEGFSKIRNRALANAFAYMNLIEKWGSGFPRILRDCRDYGLREPEILDFDGDLRVNLYRKTDQITDQIYQMHSDHYFLTVVPPLDVTCLLWAIFNS